MLKDLFIPYLKSTIKARYFLAFVLAELNSAYDIKKGQGDKNEM